jgi:ABC-2 type transport system ATP-binding protein
MLKVEHLGKVYEPAGPLLRMLVRTAQSDPVHALDGVDFELRPGEVLGVVGPNGAGKSTLIRLCTDLLTPTRGRVLVAGHDVRTAPPAVKERIGLVLADERALYWRMTGRQNLRFFGVMAGLTRTESATRAEELLERFGLADRDRRVFGYSSGMRVRLSLARALMARPDLLILDEPTRSLDPVASDHLLSILSDLASNGCTVVLATHRLEEVAATCDHALVLDGGRQGAYVHVDELRARSVPVPASLRGLLGAEPST